MSSIEINAAADVKAKRRRAPDPVGNVIIAGFFAYLIALALAWRAFILWAPDQVSLRLLGHGVTIHDVHRHVVNHCLELALIFPAILVLEMALTGWEQSSLRRLTVRLTPSGASDLASYLLWETKAMNALIVVMTLGLALLSGTWAHDQVAALTGVSFTAASWPVWLQVPVLFVIFSFFDYWNHRLDHSHYFWPLHRFHHAADDFCVLTAARIHPALFTGVVSSVLPALVLGASPDAAFDMVICSGFLRYVIHSRIDSNFGWVGRYVIQSPNHHRLHHVLDISEQPVGHFSLMPVWDHLFGTWRGEADQSLVIGVDTPYRHGAWIAADIWRDYADFWRGLYRGATGKPRIEHAPASTPS